MHLFGTSLFEHTYDLLGSRTPHKRIIDDRHSFTLNEMFDRRKFHLYLQITYLLCRLNEGSSHIVVSYDTHFKRDSQSFGISSGRSYT